MYLTFTVQVDEATSEIGLTPAEIANALSALVESCGWVPVTFHGRPATVPVN